MAGSAEHRILSKMQILRRLLEMINKSERPFLYVGGGAVISDASEEVRALAHKINAPVGDSLMGKGAFDGRDELYYRHDRYAWHKGFQLRCDRL